MNKEKQIRKQTWKYFWKQKKEEIVEHFEECWTTYFAFMIIGGFILFGMGLPIAPQEVIRWKLLIIGISLLGFWVLIGIIALIKVICNWIQSNWKEAKKKAKDKYKRENK